MSACMTREELLAQLAFLGPVHFSHAREDEAEERGRSNETTTSNQKVVDAESDKHDERVEISLDEQQDTDDAAAADDDDDDDEAMNGKYIRSVQRVKRRSVGLSSTHLVTLLAAVVVVLVAMAVIRTGSTVHVNNPTVDTVDQGGALRHLQSIPLCPFDVSFDYAPFFSGPSKTTYHHCVEPPTLVGLQLIGGMCDENIVPAQTIQDFRCEDFNGGPPRLGNTDKIHIRATDNEGTVLYAADNRMGDIIFLYNEFQPLGKYTTVTMSTTSDGVSDTVSSLLQTITFDAGCTTPAFLGNVLGAHQIVRFSNPVQKNITIDDAPQPTVVITFTDATSNVVLTQLDVATNFTNPRKLDYSPIVRGVTVGPGLEHPTLEVSFKSMNMFYPHLYQTTVSGNGKLESGEECVFEISDLYKLS
jgi:hypothetical protein